MITAFQAKGRGFDPGLLNDETFYSLKEVQVLTERWRREYNTIRPHSSLGYRPTEAWA